MSGQLQLRRGTTIENDAFTGVEGELTYDTQMKELRIHDGETQGGKVIGKNPIPDYTVSQSIALDTEWYAPKDGLLRVHLVRNSQGAGSLNVTIGGATLPHTSNDYADIYVCYPVGKGTRVYYTGSGLSAYDVYFYPYKE